MRNDMGQDHETRYLLVLNRLVKWIIFVLNRQGKAFKASVAHPCSNFPWMPREYIAKEGQEF